VQQRLCWGRRDQLHSPLMASRARGTPSAGKSKTVASRPPQPAKNAGCQAASQPGSEGAPTSTAETFANAMARYARSCDEARLLCINPRKAIPADEWPAERRLVHGALVTGQDWQRYSRYLHSIADENEKLASQARLWWAWWEHSQARPSKAGPEPLISGDVKAALRFAAAGRGSDHQKRVRGAITRAAGDAAPKRRNPNAPTREAIDSVAVGYLTALLESAKESGDYYVPGRTEIATAVSKQLNHRIHVASLFGKENHGSERVYRYPQFAELWKKVQKQSQAAAARVRGKGKPKRVSRRRRCDSDV
jgi:hypothetical protein